MSTIIQIKRSEGTSAPSTLKLGELAYSYGTGTQGNGGDRLYIGIGGVDGNGDANEIAVIGGQYFKELVDHVPGTLTASSALLVDSNKAIDEILVGNNSTTGGTIKFNEGTNNGTHFVALKAPNSVGSDLTFTLPSSYGSNGQALLSDGSGGLSFGNVATTLNLADDSSTNIAINLANETFTVAGGEGIDTSVSGNTLTVSAEDASDTNKGIASFDATDFTVSSGDVTLNTERVQDIAGAMFSSNTETLITATYQDADGTIDLVVDNDLSNYDNTTSGFITASSSETLTNKTINASQLVNGSVTNAKLAGDAIDGTKIADDAIDSEHITDGSVDNVHLANSSITINGTSISLGSSGDIVAGTDWQSIITADGSTATTATAGQGFFIDTTSATHTINLPASPTQGDEVTIVDYAGTFGTNNVTVGRNSSNIDGSATDGTLATNRLNVRFVYIDSTQGWKAVFDDASESYGASYISATGGTESTTGDYKIHTFTSSGCFVVSSLGNSAGGG